MARATRISTTFNAIRGCRSTRLLSMLIASKVTAAGIGGFALSSPSGFSVSVKSPGISARSSILSNFKVVHAVVGGGGGVNVS